jgi:hypothetical protein
MVQRDTETGSPAEVAARVDKGDFREEEEHLRVILASKIFKRAPNLSTILSYICAEYFAGQIANIREYSIAVNALGRLPSFRPDEDSIVRVEVSRLRKRLQRYYALDAPDSAIQIRIADSGYIPQFVRKPGSKSPSAPEMPSPAVAAPVVVADPGPPFFRRFRVLLAASLGMLVVAAGAVALVHALSRTPLAWSAPPGRTAGTTAGVALENEIRIAIGSKHPKYVDSMAQLWTSDRFFTGGTAVARPDRRVVGTLDAPLYRSAREGDFRYDIPVKPGVYEMRLHFADILGTESPVSDGSARRRFHVTLNGKPLLTDFDIVPDTAGPGAVDIRVFKDIQPAQDGFLHLQFVPYVNGALLNGIEIVPGTPGKLRPIRILTGARTAYDSKEQFWGADRFFLGGRVMERASAVQGTQDPELYQSERFGKFSYSIPVADGEYAVTLSFAESNFGSDNFGTSASQPGGSGSRVFDVYCNGAALLRDFDILKATGRANAALQKTFHGLRANGQGKLALWFVPDRDYATVRAIEVVDETHGAPGRE